MQAEDDFLFADGDEPLTEEVLKGAWKVLVVDDEPEIHSVTRLALEDFVFQGKRIELLSAHAGKEAQALLQANRDVALILLDVVMESDEAGLDLVRYIREKMQNKFVRIILRTGQPGQMPEKDVILNFDINDYKSKTELTTTKLFTTVVAALRTYDDIMALEQGRRGLEQIIGSFHSMYEVSSLEALVTGVLNQLIALLHLEQNSLFSFTLQPTQAVEDSTIVAGTGTYNSLKGQPIAQAVAPDVLGRVRQVVAQRESYYAPALSILYFEGEKGLKSIICLEGENLMQAQNRRLAESFIENVSLVFQNRARYQNVLASNTPSN